MRVNICKRAVQLQQIKINASQRKFTSNEIEFSPHNENQNTQSPPLKPGFKSDVEKVVKFIETKKYLVAITGAGISTESGIPDYRGPNGSYKRGHKPMTFQEFLKVPNQHKYWARSMRAWSTFSSAKPGESHINLAGMERIGIISHLITQNVDRLHHKAGHNKVTELHGTLHDVICLNCRKIRSREEIQKELENQNPSWILPSELIKRALLRPDGDLELGKDHDYTNFNIPRCECGGESILKPDVVFFGENCKKSVVEISKEQISMADGVLIFGSSCTVFSVYRLIEQAHSSGTPIGVINVGETRVDGMVNFKVEQPSGKLLSSVLTYIR